MSLEAQLEKLNANLEKLIALGSNPLGTLETRNTPLEAVKEAPAKKEPKQEKAKEPQKDEPKVEAPVIEPDQVDDVTAGGPSFDDLKDKIKALAALDREATRAVLNSFGASSLGGVPEDKYVALDLALAQAFNKARTAKGEA